MWVDAAHGVGLGHRRLAIIDLSEQGRQPMSNDSGEIRITYNGEVYNYAEIKADLVTAGFQFRGGSDTEVIVKAYEAWGIDECLRRLRGMYAFALWDRRQHALYLVRDRLGVKPLYFAHTRQHLLFGSELESADRPPPATTTTQSPGVVALFATRLCTVPVEYLRGHTQAGTGALPAHRR